jgi:hypothetical protein
VGHEEFLIQMVEALGVEKIGCVSILIREGKMRWWKM